MFQFFIWNILDVFFFFFIKVLKYFTQVNSLFAAVQFSPQTVGGAADAFQSLLRVLGAEAAIESVIGAVSLSSEP